MKLTCPSQPVSLANSLAKHIDVGEKHALFSEPAEEPWCTGWHRDITAESNGVDPEEFQRITLDATFFTQVNCALYTDCSTWYVPASDGRPNVGMEAEGKRMVCSNGRR